MSVSGAPPFGPVLSPALQWSAGGVNNAFLGLTVLTTAWGARFQGLLQPTLAATYTFTITLVPPLFLSG